MAACTKVAAFGAILRRGLRRRRRRAAGTGSRCSWAVAILTMLVGSVLAITQTDVKRMLAYSSIAHAGFILVGVLCLRPRPASRACCSTSSPTASRRSARFAVVVARARRRRRGHAPVAVGRAGQATTRSSPGVFAFLLLAFAGIPLTSGFTAKFAVVRAGGRARRRPGVAGRRRCAVQRDHGVRLRPGDRADVLHRAAGRRGRRSRCRVAVHDGRDHHRHARHARPRRRSRRRARPRRARRRSSSR